MSASFLIAESLIASFLLGSVPFGILIARAFDVKDLTGRGSGNIGATNVSRVLGFWPAGFLTFLLDALKGAIPPLLLILPPVREKLWEYGATVTPAWIWAAAFFAVVGHCYSPWMKFKGGKGVATGLGAIAVLSPFAALAGALVFALGFFATRIGSIGSLAGLMAALVVQVVFFPAGVHLWFGLLMVGLIVMRHETNVDSLLKSQERAF